MSSAGVNVLRYSALAFGVFYGFTHQRSITATTNAAHAKKEYEHQQQLIEQARAKYAEQKNPKSLSAQNSPRSCKDARKGTIANKGTDLNATVDQDPMSPSFDLEAYLNAVAAKNP
ncbi:hypothetical protein G7054_g12588 [Neopestalotiopsis clavispora]|nr:hypothetical protein G7054_g12588 [Neopestalotiopsis clavispora]